MPQAYQLNPNAKIDALEIYERSLNKTKNSEVNWPLKFSAA